MDGNVRIGCPSGNSSEATVIICGHTCPGACIIVNVLFLLGQTNNNCGQGQISKKEFTLCFFPTDQKSPGTPQRSLTTKSQNKARWYQTSHFGAVCDEAEYASWQAQLLPASPEQAKVSLYHSHDRPAYSLCFQDVLTVQGQCALCSTLCVCDLGCLRYSHRRIN